ncbi:unnamed protein product [Cylicocyclus nassatus]|uniref:DUF5641 domain-containing protein n=1 Tax=Cylicocyclus nassatus TaxID=53992 RepID=A0AA36H7N1_CYLNA|nr:unnamed protein product [Cylicocyclus nassatus]
MRLTNAVLEQIRQVIKVKHVIVLTDSEIALSWVTTQEKPESSPFIRNRICEIRKIIEHLENAGHSVRCGHISTQLNPADCATRGATKEELQEHWWWTGPDFLLQPQGNWPTTLKEMAKQATEGENEEEQARLLTKTNVMQAIQSSCKLTDTYWHQWQYEYLTALRETHKREVNKKRSSKEIPHKGKVVLIADALQPRYTWKLGRIEELVPNKEGVVREAVVKLPSQRKIRRPINLLIPLELETEEYRNHQKIEELEEEKGQPQPPDTSNQSSVTIPPIPMLNTYFITNNNETALWDRKSTPPLSCVNQEAAETLDCEVRDDCICYPAETKANCKCNEIDISSGFNDLQRRLPAEMPSVSFKQNDQGKV